MFIDFLEREERKGGRREREREKSVAPYAPDWNRTLNQGMCPDQESNLQPLAVWDDTPNKWATQQGLDPLSTHLLMQATCYRRNQENVLYLTTVSGLK